MAKLTGAAAALQIGTADDAGATAPGSDTFTTIGAVRSISGPSGDKGEVDVTDLASTGREFLASIPDYGEVQFTGWHDETEATQTTLWADFVDQSDSHIRNYRITLNDGTSYDFNAYIKSLAHNVEFENGIELNGSVRITGGITRALS